MKNKGRWVTAHSRLEQVDSDLFELVDNELYRDVDGTLYLAPRGTLTDNFSRPFGNKQKYDVRPSHIHDIGCRYKQLIIVDCCLNTLKSAGLLQGRGDINNRKIILEDVPLPMLKIVDVTKKQVDDLFYRMCEATDMPKWATILYRAGVFCNVGWLWSGKEKIQKENIYLML